MSPRSLVRCALVFASTSLIAATSFGQFARPPEDQTVSSDQTYEPEQSDAHPALAREPRSTARVNVGPAMLLQPAMPGLFAALDIGRRSVGARFSGAWLNAEQAGGLAQYNAEL